MYFVSTTVLSRSIHDTCEPEQQLALIVKQESFLNFISNFIIYLSQTAMPNFMNRVLTSFVA